MSEIPMPSEHPPQPKPSRAGAHVTTAAVVVAAAVGLTLFGFAMLNKTEKMPEVAVSPVKVQGKELTIPVGSPSWAYVKVAAAAPDKPIEPLPVAGRVAVDETKTSRISSPLQGLVDSVTVRLGQEVKAGDVLLAVRSGALVDLQAEQRLAQAHLRAQSRNLARIQSLVQLQAAPEKDLVAAREAFEEGKVALQAAELKQHSLRVRSESSGRFEILAPRAGVVVLRDVSPGQEVGPDRTEPLLVIAELEQVWAVASVPEAEVEGIEENQLARVWLPSSPGRSVPGTVTWVSPLVDPDRHTVDVRVRVDNKDGHMRPNAWVQVAFAPAGAPRIVIPAASVVTDDERSVVFIKQASGKLERRDVQPGRQRDGRVEILQGLKEGEQVVVEGALLLLNAMVLSK
jgi:cobalt-zinc-cadmium efflux system membrane fusion protein